MWRPDATIHQLFREQVAADPTRIALVWNGGTLSYGELDGRSDALAACLIDAGVRTDVAVVIALDRSADAVIALLAILKAGGAYLPLDPRHPRERLAFMAADADAAVTITNRQHAAMASLTTTTLFVEDTPAGPAAMPPDGVKATHLAYVMYTSGSTGTPKGVQIEHRSVVRLVGDVEYVRLDRDTCFLHASPLGFDASTLELWGPLLHGGRVAILPDRLPTGPAIAHMIRTHGVTTAWLTSALFNSVVDDSPAHLRGLRQLLIGGEALSPAHVRRALAELPGTEIVNGYGPTECTTFTTTYSIPPDLPADAASIPIGRPIADTQVHVLQNGRPAAPGEAGELFVGGRGVARGYLRRPELTEERFVHDPDRGRLYRTGDLVRLRSDGVLEFIGRADQQVKIRGFRIEPGEIETHLAELDGVQSCAVVARGDGKAGKRLVAYVVLRDRSVTSSELRAALSTRLPDFAVPAVFVELPALPLTANGKVDRGALPAPAARRPDLAQPLRAPSNPREATICRVFREVLGLDDVGVLDSFFELGGDSLLLMRALLRLKAEGFPEVTPATFFGAPTPAALARAVEGPTDAARVSPPAVSTRRAGVTPEPVAIIGMAGRFPGARDVEAFWRNLCGGVESIRTFDPTELDPSIPGRLRDHPDYVPARGVLDDVALFDAGFFGISRREAELTDPQHRLFLEVCWEALEHAGYVPERAPGAIGVFGGMYNATYYQRHLWPRLDVTDGLDELTVMLGNEKDYLATRVAHRLGLTGPAVGVHTACSTSLVATALAMDSLRSGACDLALAGGVAVTCPPQSGYLYHEGAMASRDGHTRPFDARAHGTVFSDGVAVVLLRRLSEAVAAGDTIYAVLLGAAVNNDGGDRASFTAPSPIGQASVIAAALDAAAVDSRSVSYVEAHGTGTPLGDPVEIDGLTRAFRRHTADSGFCSIGSLKGNVGHLVIAAGAASLIKVSLALSRRQLPPSIGFDAPNPAIDFSRTPFRVQTALEAWPDSDNGAPRRAGVSAFGFGGTNCHVVLEEPPAPPPTMPSPRPAQVLVLSARTPAALEAASARLATHLSREDAAPLADVAHTLRVGRRAFAHRRYVVASTAADAAEQLASTASARTGARSVPAELPDVAFMCPGQGAQYAAMGRGLYAAEPAFRAAYDECLDIIRSQDGDSITRHLFADDAEALTSTAVLQPAIFSLEYALARLWLEWGVVPSALIGHSVGELVCATLAGVFSLEDALAFVIARGRLVQAAPAGGMLSVRAGASEVQARWPDAEIASDNAPRSCVVAGTTEALAVLENELAADGIAARRLTVSHAFHSSMMDPVVDSLRAHLEGVRLRPPSIPILSTVTAEWLTEREATDPDYWAAHVRATVRFGPAMARLAVEPRRLLLEVGPRNTLSTLARQAVSSARARVTAIPSLEGSAEREPEAIAQAVGHLWTLGVPMDWTAYDAREQRRRVPLPTYPFERRRYWIDAPAAADAPDAPRPSSAIAAPSVSREALPPDEVPVPTDAHMPIAASRTEARIREFVTEVSDADLMDIDPETHWFELGLDSLALAQLGGQLQRSFHTKMSLRQLLEDCTSIQSLAAYLDRTSRESAPQPVVPEQANAPSGWVPSTEPQREIWLAARLSEHASLAYNQSVSLRLTGTLDAAAMQRAMAAIYARHDALRATFSADGLSLRVAETVDPLRVPLTDLSPLAAPERERRLASIRERHVTEPFNLECGPLIRAELVRLTPTHHVAILTAHHIVMDGWSFGVIAKDLAALYGQATGTRTAPLADAPSFRRYALERAASAASAEQAEAEQWWLGQLTAPLPALELPTDRSRPPVRTHSARRCDRVLPADLVEALRKLGAGHGNSLFATLLAAVDALLFRITGQDDVIVGVPAAGQATSGLTGLVGHAVSMLPIRVQLSRSQTFGALMAAARTALLEGAEHHAVSFGRLLQLLPIGRTPNRVPLIPVVLNVDQVLAGEVEVAPGLALELTTNPRQFETFEVFIDALDAGADGLRLECHYNADLFDDTTIARWLAALETLLRSVADNPNQAVGSLPVASPDEERLYAQWNNTTRPYPTDVRIEALIASTVRRLPDRIAIRTTTSTFTYRDVQARANAVGAALAARGVAGGRVGLLTERDGWLLPSMLGTLAAGAAYVPLDPKWPAARLSFVLADAAISAVVVSRTLAARHGDAIGGTPTLVVDDLLATDDPPPRVDNAEAEAYVIYTSGSTGVPKGVAVPHRAVVNLLYGIASEPGLTEDDVALATTTLSFDIAVSELLLPLFAGSTIVLADRDQASDGDRLRQLIESQDVTFIDATPTTWRLLQAAGWAGSARVTAICTGEVLPPDLAAWLQPRVGALWNGYGPTETTVWSAFHRVNRAAGPIPIGRPIANTCIYVLDHEGAPVPLGSTGELWIGGDGVALGYVGRPEMTAARFRPDPFRNVPGARMYRTGDLGRWRPDGVLEYFGRIDRQIKLRGHRLELGELEAALRAQGTVADAVATTWEPNPGDVRLVAYVTPNEGAPEDALRAALGRTLPEYMVPQRILRVDRIPLTSSGKVDRAALPSPAEAGAGAAAVTRRTLSSTEERIARAFADALAIAEVSVHDDFFALGGHSLLAAQVTMRLAREFDRAVPMGAVFEHPTVASLADWLDSSISVRRSSPVRTARRDDEPAPLSLMQQRVWYVEQLQPGTTVFHLPSAHRIRSRFDETSFRGAFDAMIQRHEALRTVIRVVDGDAMQHVLPSIETALGTTVDLSALPPDQREQELASRLDAEASRRFDLTGGPLFHARLFRLSDDDHVFFFMPHHVIWDGASFDIFHDELAASYRALCRGSSLAEPPPSLTYRDFSVWHRQWMEGSELGRQVEYWRTRLTGAPAALDIPVDHARPTTQSGEGGSVRFTLARDLSERLRRVAERDGATVFMTLLAAWAAVLHACTRQRDLVVGVATSGRHLPDVERLIGFFANSIPLRLAIDPGRPFGDLLRVVKAAAAEALDYQDVPLEHLVRVLGVPRDHSRFPIYQAFFSYQDRRGRAPAWADLGAEEIPVFDPSAAQDLALWMVDGSNGLSGALNYNTDILNKGTADLLQARYLAVLEAVAADPGRALHDVVNVPPEERMRLQRWSAGPDLPALHRSVPALLADAFARHGSRVAVRYGDDTVTYDALGRHAAAITTLLHARGVRPHDVVGLRCRRSPAMVAAVAGVLGAGAAYLPLDPDYPATRLETMIDDAGVAVVLRDEDIDIAPGDERYEAGPAAAEDVAYLIYTSGSSGKPNGVRVPHRAVLAFLDAMRTVPGLQEDDRLVAVTTLSFDIAVLELLLPLAVGAEIVLASREQATDGLELRALIERTQATVMQATPATWRLLIEAGWPGSLAFKALCGGEALSIELAEALLARAGDVWNMYGPTETTVWSTCGRVEPGQGEISIGRPIAGTTAYVLDEAGRMAPIGVPGELYLGGAGVTLGYHHRPELTDARFVPDPFSTAPGARLYRTGDLARWRTDGTLQHLGRIDFQVKIRGHRVETGEIESALLEHAAVAEAVVVAGPGPGGETRLVAYVVPQPEEGAPPAGELKEHVRHLLPPYMVPAVFVPLPAIPRTPNGKVNRRALPEPAQVDQPLPANDVSPLTATEQLVADVWRELLGVDRIDRLDNFIDLGGHSLLIMRAISTLEDRTGRRVNPRSFIFQTLEQLAREYDERPAVNAPPARRRGSSSRRSLLDRVLAALTANREA